MWLSQWQRGKQNQNVDITYGLFFAKIFSLISNLRCATIQIGWVYLKTARMSNWTLTANLGRLLCIFVKPLTSVLFVLILGPSRSFFGVGLKMSSSCIGTSILINQNISWKLQKCKPCQVPSHTYRPLLFQTDWSLQVHSHPRVTGRWCPSEIGIILNINMLQMKWTLKLMGGMQVLNIPPSPCSRRWRHPTLWQ